MQRMLVAIAILFLIPSVAQAKHHRHYRHHSHHYQHHQHYDANGNSAYAKVHTIRGLTATVAASAREKFQGFIDAVEALPELGVGYFVDAVKVRGNEITDIGCLSSGHMPGSKHHTGRACDFGQLRRNVTTDKFMYHVASIAHEHGLIDGCEWGRKRGERYTGPDCGHIEVPGETKTYSANNHHHRHHYRKVAANIMYGEEYESWRSGR